MKFVYLIAALAVYLMSHSIEANAADKAPVFDMLNSNNSMSINNLTCGQFLDLLHEKDPSSVDIMIWIHGLVSGSDGTIKPFSREFVTGAIYLVERGCSDRSTPLVKAISDGEHLVVGGKQ